jgi:hypothetical protein
LGAGVELVVLDDDDNVRFDATAVGVVGIVVVAGAGVGTGVGDGVGAGVGHAPPANTSTAFVHEPPS